ncbi:divalent-cation tolerance protein CutA [Alphaproteobacteria bacterium]|jgi:periplasmic divalent cation tolerance protein|nr:divalent-cation tolerance protein CutA [Alphaproteobacteria bacterium]
MTASIVYVTAPNKNEALRIAQTLVEEHLVACVSMLPGTISIYRWNDCIQQSQEVSLFLKTSKDHIEAVTERVISLHSHDCPCVVNWSITGGNRGFLDWIETETSPK